MVLERLLGETELTTAPVTFVCHSLGGLVVKKVLRAANDQQAHRPEAGMLLDWVKAVMFTATHIPVRSKPPGSIVYAWWSGGPKT